MSSLAEHRHGPRCAPLSSPRRRVTLAALTLAALAPACAANERCDETPPLTDASAWPQVVELAFPLAAADLAGSLYIATHGHLGYTCGPETPEDERACSLDLSARRWDPREDAFSRTKVDGGASEDEPFGDDVMWEMPVHAPINGRVIACWRGMPDDDDDGDDTNCPGGAKICTAAGNFVTILSDDGFIVSLCHLRAETIPLGLCPITDRYLYADDPKRCTLGGQWKGYRELSRLDRRGLAEPVIHTGDFVGKVGASGSGKGIHLHVHAKPYAHDGVNHCEGPSLPLAFHDVQVTRPCDGVDPATSQWLPLAGDVPPIDGGLLLFDPDPGS